jgi:CRISPR-associated protein Cas1
MQKDLFILTSGKIIRKQNTLWFENSKTKKPLPISTLNSVSFFGEIELNNSILELFTKYEISCYFYNYFGFYSGGYFPRKQQLSGKLLVKQVTSYEDINKRLELAKETLIGTIVNISKNLEYYKLDLEKIKILSFISEINKQNSIVNLMLSEAKFRQYYYSCFDKILNDETFKFVRRSKRPPLNFLNCLISFGNSCFYNTVLSEILKTQLDPTISFLHEPFERRYSLNLDISEIFKPIIVDRVIFKLINKKMITEKHFEKNLNYSYLNEKGRKIFLQEFDNKLTTTFRHNKLKRKISYRYLIRLECYKLIKYFIEDVDYKSFKYEDKE